jgi:hypothetical protein
MSLSDKFQKFLMIMHVFPLNISLPKMADIELRATAVEVPFQRRHRATEEMKL